jgi:hypothetical protein
MTGRLGVFLCAGTARGGTDVGFLEFCGLLLVLCLLLDAEILEMLGHLFLGLVGLAFWVLVVVALFNLATL